MSSRLEDIVGLGEATAKRQRLGGIADVDAGGNAVIRGGRPPAGTFWLVDRGAFVAVGPAAGTVRILVFSTLSLSDDDLEDFADLAVGAAQATVRALGEWNPPIWIPPGGDFVVTFSGAVAGTQAKFRAVARPLLNL